MESSKIDPTFAPAKTKKLITKQNNINNKKNNIMKKSIFFVLALVMSICLPLTLMADNDQVITFDRLPATAQTMLKQNFSDKVPLVITADSDD